MENYSKQLEMLKDIKTKLDNQISLFTSGQQCFGDSLYTIGELMEQYGYDFTHIPRDEYSNVYNDDVPEGDVTWLESLIG